MSPVWLRLGLCALIADLSYGATESIDLEKRIERLEKARAQSLLNEGAVSTFDSRSIHFGGNLSVAWGDIFGSGIPNQTSVDRVSFEPIVSADIVDNLRFFGQLSFRFFSTLQDRDAYSKKFDAAILRSGLESAHFEYTVSNPVALKVGMMPTPFGIVNQERFIPLLLTYERPLFNENGNLLDRRLRGVDVFGTCDVGTVRLTYHAFGGTNESDANHVAGGARVALSLAQDRIVLGVSDMTQERNGTTYSVFGSDFKWSLGSFSLQVEYLRGSLAGFPDGSAYYVQPSFSLFDDKVVVFGQIDYLKDPTNTRRGVKLSDPRTLDPIEKSKYTVGVNYLPWHILRTRFEVARVSYTDTGNYWSAYASAAVTF